ncbi:MAG: aminopeptidase P N-terminal domain-containing protein [Polyangiaceae bacterium]|nr:aminopeptidase P N-terminal domain-containing protein [Polyangiaceae bacterium]
MAHRVSQTAKQNPADIADCPAGERALGFAGVVADIFSKRRSALMTSLGDSALVIPAASVRIRNGDVDHEYRQDSDFHYLTGFDEPQSVAVFRPGTDEPFVLFARPHDRSREIWEGPRAGLEGARADFGADLALAIEELDAKLPGLLTGFQRVYYRFNGQSDFDKRFLAILDLCRRLGRQGKTYPTEIVDTETILHRARRIKSDDEVDKMARAAAITGEAHKAAMRLARSGLHEYHLDAALRNEFLQGGAQRAAYPSIVASGNNATYLHYVENRAPLGADDLVLIDAGCEYEYYASDVTRCFPVSGRFTPAQRELYELVLQSQIDAVNAVRPGATLQAIHDGVRATLAEGLRALGFPPPSSLSSSDQADIDAAWAKPYFMHKTSHYLGMDVHDVGPYFQDGAQLPLESGVVVTIEPGLYVPADDMAAPEQYRGIGIRIEDDVLVTTGAPCNLSSDIPKSIEDVERECARG